MAYHCKKFEEHQAPIHRASVDTGLAARIPGAGAWVPCRDRQRSWNQALWLTLPLCQLARRRPPWHLSDMRMLGLICGLVALALAFALGAYGSGVVDLVFIPAPCSPSSDSTCATNLSAEATRIIARWTAVVGFGRTRQPVDLLAGVVVDVVDLIVFIVVHFRKLIFGCER